MKTRHLTFAFALGIASCLAVAAQSPDTQTAPQYARHPANPAMEAKRLARTLNLSPDQVTQLQPILADRAQQRSAIFSDASLAPADRRAKMVNLRQTFDAKIKAILTADQQQKYDEMHARMGQHRQK